MQTITGGVWPAMLTPLTDEGRPNLPVVDDLVALFIEQGLDGLFVLGSTGQGPALSVEDRRAVAERAVRAAHGRVPVMVHVGAVATTDAVLLARHASEIGADAVSAVPPIYYPSGADATFHHYELIAQAAGLPFFPYHAAFLQQAMPSPREYARRLQQVPHFAGMKITDRDLYTFGLIRQYVGDDPIVFSGPDELVCHAALCGANGAIGSTYNLFGPAVRSAREAFVDGDIGRGQRFMAAYQVAIDRILAGGGIYHFLRGALKLTHNIDIGPGIVARFIAGHDWDEGELREIIETVEAAG